MLGIALGVAALITVLSVMNGFSKEIRNKMLNIAPHIIVRPISYPVDYLLALANIKELAEVKGVAPFVNLQGLLVQGENIHPGIIRGIDLQHIESIFPLTNSIVAGNISSLQYDNFNVLVGRELALSLDAWVGDKITIVLPETNASLVGVTPKLKRVTIAAVFDTKSQFDNKHVFMSLVGARKLTRRSQQVDSIEIKLHDELQAPQVAYKLEELLGEDFYIQTWMQQYASFFDAIKMEKTVMWCILILIVMVAAFNLVSSLVMVVTDKEKDIAILRTMGMPPSTVRNIFIVQGSIIGITGTLLGLIFGLLLAYNVTAIVDVIQNLFKVNFIAEDVYFIGYVPSLIKLNDLLIITLAALSLSFIATIYPARRAARILPAEALRYE